MINIQNLIHTAFLWNQKNWLLMFLHFFPYSFPGDCHGLILESNSTQFPLPLYVNCPVFPHFQCCLTDITAIGPVLKHCKVSKYYEQNCRLIWIYRIQWWCSLLLFYTRNTLFVWVWFKNQNCQFKLKFCTNSNSNMQYWMVIFICFVSLVQNISIVSLSWIPFWGKLGPKIQNCLFKVKFDTSLI